MNENMNYRYEEEREIDLIDLMFYLMKRWKTLIVAIVIGAVIGGGIYFVKKQNADQLAAEKSAQKAAVDAAMETEEDPEELLKNYKVSPDVKANMELAYQYRQLYRKQLEYNQNSVIMQMDPSKVYSGELKYYITAGSDTRLIGTLYENILNESDIVAELKEAAELECEEQYIRELIGVSVSKDNGTSIEVNKVSSATAESIVVTFWVNAPDKESSEQMLQVIRDKVDMLNRECEDAYDGYSMIKINDSVRLIASSDYLSRQKTNADQLSNYLSNMSRLESAFAEADLEYYNLAYLAREYKGQPKEEQTNTETEVVEEVEPVTPVKWLVIGIFLMCCCWGGYYLVKYLLDSRIKSADEVQDCYRLPLIGTLEDQKGNARKDWVDKLHDKCRKPYDTDAYIVASVNALDSDRILLCGDQTQEAVQKLMEAVKEHCSKAGTGNLPGQDVQTLEAAKNVDAVVLVFQVGVTRRSEIQRELDVCRMQKIQVLGSIVIA